MKIVGLSVAIGLAVLFGQQAQANDIQKALGMVKDKLNGNSTVQSGQTGQSGLPAALQNKLPASLTNKLGVGNFSVPNTASPLTPNTGTNTSSIKSLLQQAAQKVGGSSTLPVTSAPMGSPATVLTNPSTGLPLVPQPQNALGKDPQSVKVKVGKEILRQATKYNAKHPNKLMGKGINELNRVINK